MNSLWRKEQTNRVRADDLLQKIPGGQAQTILTEFWEEKSIVTTTGKCGIKRFGGIPGASMNRGVW